MAQNNHFDAAASLLDGGFLQDGLIGGILDPVIEDLLEQLLEGTLLEGTLIDNVLNGTIIDEDVRGTQDNDFIRGNFGDDRIYGFGGSDALYGGSGDDRVMGGRGIDLVDGGTGNDRLWGDVGPRAPQGSDLASDQLVGGSGDDTLVQGDGNDVMTGGSDADTFYFRWTDPVAATDTGTARAVTDITDFNAREDRLAFDVEGVRGDMAGVDFIDGGAGDGTPGGRAATFFRGAAEDSNGEAVMILVDQGYASADRAVRAATGEAEGDLIVYYDATADRGTLLYVDGADQAHAIAVFSDMATLGDLRSEGFTAGDFLFV